MTRISISYLLAMFVMTSVSCQRQSSSPRPQNSIGIEEHPGVTDLFQFAEKQRAKHNLPALGVGMIRDGKIVGLGMAGERKAGSGDWATLNDRFDVASCSKSFTATVAAMLVEKGQVRWDMTVKEVFPELGNVILPAYSDVTLEMFLRHRSGLEQWMRSNELWAKWHQDRPALSATEKRYQFAAKVLKDKPRSTPGTQTYYCNGGYLVAASMMEKMTGKPWEQSVREMLFEPLGLTSARFGHWPGDAKEAIVWGHGKSSYSGAVPIKPDVAEFGDPPFGSPGGFLSCTVADLLRFVDFHIQGANGNGTLLTRQSFDRLHTPLEGQHFALGWEVETQRDKNGTILERSIYHGGFSGRFRSNMWFCPESRTGTVIVYNYGGDDGTGAYADIFHALLQEFKLTPAQAK